MKSLGHFSKFLLGIDQPATQVSEKELALLLKYSLDADVIVEIGCYEGRTTAALAGNSQGTVYSIDPFFTGRLGVCYSEWIAKINCRKLGLRNIRFLKAYSYVAAPAFGRPIDFLFIDADHTYDAIKKDWADWFPKVKDGGIIALHDCRVAPNSPEHLGSMKFYEEYIPTVSEIREIEAVDCLSLFEVKRNGRS